MILASVLSGFGAALAAPALTRRLRGRAGWLLALLPIGLTVYFIRLLPRASAGEPATASYPWAASLGLTLSFRADGLSLLFALLISGIGALVVIYSGGYLKDHAHLGRFYAWLLAFMAAMLGVALADNLVLLFVFWELTSLSSFMLIGFDHQDESSRAAALQALLVTAGGGLALLAGLVLLGLIGGTLEISALLSRGDALRSSPLYAPALVLVLIGAFTKSAQFPFHFWLPNAMVAPTPVSAYLHSATMVKAGVYLLARLGPALGGSEIWTYTVGGVGLITMLLGGWLALSQTDLKRLLAYSTVSALGLLTLLIGLGTTAALKAATVFLLAHALYKGALFLVAGAIDHETGTRDVTQLGGLFRAMPRVAASAGVAALSMAGVLPLFGFISKELVYEVALESGSGLTAAIVASGLSFVFVAGVTGLGPFWGRAPRPSTAPVLSVHAYPAMDDPDPVKGVKAHEVPVSLWFGPMLLAGLSVLFGLAPELIAGSLAGPAASAAVGKATEVKLALWHGINPAFVLSLATLIAGAGLTVAHAYVRRGAARLTWTRGLDAAYALALRALNASAELQTRALQSGFLRYYLTIIVLTTVGLAGFTLIGRSGLHWPTEDTGLRFYEVGLGALILLAALMAIRSRSRLSAVAALGAAGYGVALIYLLFGAPDLALTQFLIESLTVILFVLAFYHLPHFAQLSLTRSRVRDAAVALLAGGLMTALVLSAAGIQLHPSISDYFVETAWPEAHGRNIVNVILVDFRAIDTLGEITVLGIAAIGVYALLKLTKARASNKQEDE